MLSVIWSNNGWSEGLFLAAAIVAALAAIFDLLRHQPVIDPIAVLVPAAVCLISLGLLAL